MSKELAQLQNEFETMIRERCPDRMASGRDPVEAIRHLLQGVYDSGKQEGFRRAAAELDERRNK